MKFILFLTLIFSAVILPVAIYGQERSLNIIYTGSVNGELEPCGCSPKTDFGGLARLSGYLAAHRNELSPYILVDAGNFTDKDTPQGKLKAAAVLRSYSIMKYDAVAIMNNEKAFPHEFIVSLLKDHAIPAVSDALTFDQSLLIDREGIKVNISVNPDGNRKDAVNVLLTDRPVSGAGLIKGWDVIIVSSGDILDEPLKVDGTVIVTGYPRGKKTGILTLTNDSEGGVKKLSHKWISLGADIEEDAKVRSVLNEYDLKVSGLLKESAKPLAGDTYLGAAMCAECHLPYEESWKKTRHAGAFDILIKAGKSNDPECIACHSVGFGEKGGFFTLETTPELANVQCEECHGLDREHIEDFSRPMRRVTEKICLKCHTKENSPDFDYPVYLKKIIH
jgi:2',3'-cyclic-nucleotide 2'-phosphodiesterase (5'-nucleotidase family)